MNTSISFLEVNNVGFREAGVADEGIGAAEPEESGWVVVEEDLVAFDGD